MLYDDMFGVNFMLSFYRSAFAVIYAPIVGEAARQFVLIPIILSSIVALTIIFVHLLYPQFFSRITAPFKAILLFTKMRKWTKNSSLDEVIEDAGFAYDPEQDIFYSELNAWQRNFGYCRMYDEASAPLNMIIDCEPIYFEYDGKSWLIEFWKGQYGITMGGEIGVFTSEDAEIIKSGYFSDILYDSASDKDLLQIYFSLSRNGIKSFTREDLHWWLTGFKLGEFSQPSELTMDIDITLKDKAMCYEFLKGLKNAGYSYYEIIKNGNTISLKFDKPHTPQPITRTPATDWLVQKKNEQLCTWYQEITSEQSNMHDKLKAIQKQAPEMIEEITNIRKTKQLFEMHKKLTNYSNEKESKK